MLRVDAVPVGPVTLTVDAPEGRCLGILGTDAVHLRAIAETLAGLRPPLAGRVTIDGLDTWRDADQVRARITLSLARAAHPLTSLSEHVRTIAAARVPLRLTATAAITQLGLRPDLRLSTPAARAAAALIAALLPEARLVVLHEPFADLDDTTRTKAIEWIRSLDRSATTVVMTGTRERDVRAVAHTVIDAGAGR